MVETKTFSLPEEIVEKVERYMAATGLKASTIATKALEDFMAKPEISAIVNPTPTTSKQA